MDTAVKFYSSGMLVRLGFACAVHVDPEIVLIDEVLAVGDEAFQARCLDKVRSFQREGRSIVIVSHALDVVRQLCDRAVMLDHGRVHAIGSPDDVVREMRLTILHHDLEFAREEGSKEVEIVHVELLRDDVRAAGTGALGGDAHRADRSARRRARRRSGRLVRTARRDEQLRVRRRHRAARPRPRHGRGARDGSGSGWARSPSPAASTGSPSASTRATTRASTTCRTSATRSKCSRRRAAETNSRSPSRSGWRTCERHAPPHPRRKATGA